MIKESRKRRVTVFDIAEDAGVSKSTVSLVLQDSPRIPEKTRLVVRKSMQRLGYVYNRGAAIMRSGRSQTIGIIVNDLRNPFFAQFIAGVGNAVQKEGFVTLLTDSGDDLEGQSRIFGRLCEHNVDGIILCPAKGTKLKDIAGLRSQKPATLLAVRNLPRSGLDFVGADFAFGAHLAVDHLFELGHRRIAFVGDLSSTSTSREKVAGFEQRLVASAMSATYVACDVTRAGGYHAAARVLRTKSVTACLCFNDLVAMGLMSGLQALGKSVPDDISIVGFDGLPDAEFSGPPLTTVSVEAEEIGRRAGRDLLELVDLSKHAKDSVIVRPKLIVRNSSGPVRPRG